MLIAHYGTLLNDLKTFSWESWSSNWERCKAFWGPFDRFLSILHLREVFEIPCLFLSHFLTSIKNQKKYSNLNFCENLPDLKALVSWAASEVITLRQIKAKGVWISVSSVRHKIPNISQAKVNARPSHFKEPLLASTCRFFFNFIKSSKCIMRYAYPQFSVISVSYFQ